MPIYAYRCAACGHAKDVLQRMSDPLLTTCPVCGAEAFTKQVTAAGFQLKGSGWYVTDFRGGNAGAPKSGAEADGTQDGSKAGDGAAGKDAAKGAAVEGGNDGSKDGAKPAHGTTSADAPSKPTAAGDAAKPAAATGDARRTTAAAPGGPGAAAAPGRPLSGTEGSRSAVSSASPLSPPSPSPSALPPSTPSSGPALKKYLLAGLLVWLPLAVTIWVLTSVLGLLDGVFEWILNASQAVLPNAARDSLEALKRIPGLGVIVMLIGLLLTGMFATNMVGQWSLSQGARVLNQIPIVKSIYSSVKQVSDTLFSSSGNAFREAVLVQYPREGSWTIAFVTGRPGGEAASHLHDDYLSLYVPTTPNPTSGFFLMVPRADVIALAMSVDEALKYIISMGVVAPPPVFAVSKAPPPAAVAPPAARNHIG